MFTTRKLGTALVTALMVGLLAACGGGGGDDDTAGGGGNGGGGGGGGGGGDGGGSTTLTYMYRATQFATDVDGVTNLLTSQGAEGYRYVGPAGFGSGQAIELSELFAKDLDTTYEYRLLDTQNGESDALAQFNAQGAEGYRYYGDLAIGPVATAGVQKSVFVRDHSNPGNYEYRALEASATRDAFLTQANDQGNQGYWYISGAAFGNTTAIKHLYMTDKSRPEARYAYRAVDSVDTRDALVNQLNEQGGQGYKYKGPDFIYGTLYVRDTSQDATYDYQIEDSPQSASAFVTRANELGGQGYGFLTTLVQGDIYVRPQNCSGYLCTVLHPMTLN